MPHRLTGINFTGGPAKYAPAADWKHPDGPVGGSKRTQQAGKLYGLFGGADYRKGANRRLLMIGPDPDTQRKQLFAGHGRLYCAAIEQFSVRQRSRAASASSSAIASAKVTSPSPLR